MGDAMKRLTLGIAIGVLCFSTSFAGAKLANVTNPMGTDLDGGAHSITNVDVVDAGMFQAVPVGTTFPDGVVQGGTFYVVNRLVAAPEIISGRDDPNLSCPSQANPGSLYLRSTTDPPTTGQLWVKTANPCGWTRVA